MFVFHELENTISGKQHVQHVSVLVTASDNKCMKNNIPELHRMYID